jgi:hypothetical protein
MGDTKKSHKHEELPQFTGKGKKLVKDSFDTELKKVKAINKINTEIFDRLKNSYTLNEGNLIYGEIVSIVFDGNNSHNFYNDSEYYRNTYYQKKEKKKIRNTIS